MIKFFRHIRKPLLNEGKTSKYFKYAIGEIVLVVIGILIALQINNFNEQRKDREKEQIVLKQLKEGVIQRKLKESASKEETQFLNNELILLGTNLQPNKDNLMHDKLVLDPFLKQRNTKTLFPPINRKRLSEKLEQQRLKEEKEGE